MEYSNAELRILENELLEYKLDIPCDKVEDKTPYCGIKGEKKWYVDNKALKDTDEWIITDLAQYQQLNSKLTQLRKLQAKTEYAKKMDKMAELKREENITLDNMGF